MQLSILHQVLKKNCTSLITIQSVQLAYLLPGNQVDSCSLKMYGEVYLISIQLLCTHTHTRGQVVGMYIYILG